MRLTLGFGSVRAIHLALVLWVGFTSAGCGDEPATWTPPPDLAGADVVKGLPKELPNLQPFYTEEQCTALRRSFPGWSALADLPENDAKGRPTLWYAIIPITKKGQPEDLQTVGIDVMSMPLIVDEATDPQSTGQMGIMTKSTCGSAELHWAVVPGLTYNTIKKQTIALKEELVESIILLPVPDDFADVSITGPGGGHPLSYEVLGEGGYHYMGMYPTADAQSDALSADSSVETKRGALFGWIKKKVVSTVAAIVHAVPNLAERGLAEVDKFLNSTVSLRVRLDPRNTDTTFGGDMSDVPGGPKDQSSPILRGWGPLAGTQLDLAGVTVAATQITLSIKGRGLRTRVEDDAKASNMVGLTVVKGKTTGFCMETETSAVEMTDFLTEMEVCDFQNNLVAPTGAPFGDNKFEKNTSIVVRIQNKFFNMLAQMNDSQRFTRDVYHYDPHKASLLTGKMANKLIPFHADRLVTPCLDFPNLGVDVVAALAPTVCIASAVTSKTDNLCSVAFINETLGVYEVDMWIPTEGLAQTERRLDDRQIPTHEYGHFMMCSMLFDADWKKMRQVPNLIIQRMLDGSFMNAGDESAIIMEAWADYFASQLTGGTNYFQPENSIPSDNGLVNYCDAQSSACLDLNYVEDNDETHLNSTQAVGFRSQIRQTVSIVTDAFDGRAFGTNDPNTADIMTLNMMAPPKVVPSSAHAGDARDEPIALPGGALRTIVDRWVDIDVARWKVDRQQFHGAITQVMRENKASWCDTCRVYSPHDGKACAFAPGAVQQTGECRDPATLAPVAATMTMAQMVGICSQPPISGYVGPRPAATDPTTDCTFAGCAPHKRLVGVPGSLTPIPTCVECGPRQISTGTVPCASCAVASVSAATCTDCPATQVVGGMDKNSCVDCPADSAPNGTATCQVCGVRSVPRAGVCAACAENEIETPDHACVACPAATPFRLDNTCVASCDCTSAAKSCLIPQGNVCVPSPCSAHQIKSGNSCVACPPGSISVNGTACVACESSRNLFQSDNQCVACPSRNISVPAAAPTACQLCPRGSVPFVGLCFACHVATVSGDDNTCHACPAGQLPLNDVCIPISECVDSPEHCGRIVDPQGFCRVVIC